ncbi:MULTISPECIES: hypothetical protein [Lactobacillus]|uniref:Uncharacterized protein n=1 Tax=Lactobacillus xujianguonis TaxID=2495899 RepID=A0A437SVE3_9LACO|nr:MULTISPECIES: hypothetical protein [Lactobacillus]RVU70893.1 hypothetical protein EJK17_04880 [Lactobacillus xujianguonis]RVU73760.1 hypothetical protein EJK20_06545 [Lactobacillus xujianguonis]
MLIIKILFITLISFLLVCNLAAGLKTLTTHREKWFVYEGQGMTFAQAFVRYLVKCVSFGQTSLQELVGDR